MPTIYYRDESCTLWHGRCEDVLPLIEPESVDLVLTDPPYGIGKAVWDRNMPIDWFVAALRLLRPSGAAYVFGNPLTLSRLQVFWEERGVSWTARASWVYESGPRHARRWVGKHEDCLVYTGTEHEQSTPTEPSIHKDPRWGNDRYIGDVWHVPRILGNNSERTEHPTQKPVELLSMLILAASRLEDVVLDPFMGSGTTLRAAKDLGRKAIGIEIEERYCDIAANRLQQQVMDLVSPPRGGRDTL